MTASTMLTVANGGRRLVATLDGQSHEIHPLWLRERSLSPGSVDPDNGQRLFDPCDLDPDLTLTGVDTTGSDSAEYEVSFSDGHQMTVSTATLARWVGAIADPEAPPAAVGWDASLDPFPWVEWSGIAAAQPDAMLESLDSFHRLGFFVLRGVPTTPGTLRDVVAAYGHLTATNFGELFDVVSVANPSDLAYTSLHLSAHTDNPYRRPVPGIQLLHALVNDAAGGDSTLADGFAAVCDLADTDPDAYAALCSIPVEFRYDTGSDVVVSTAPVIELDPWAGFASLRFSTRLDFAAPAIGGATDLDALGAFYRGRRWLRDRLNDPAHQLTFRLDAGDVMFMDNHRLTHGRTAFEPSTGNRHLQGCYLEHEGPDRAWRLAWRALQP